MFYAVPFRMMSPIIPFRSGQSSAGQATGSHLDAGYFTASFSNNKIQRKTEGSNNLSCKAGFPLHCEFILHQIDESRINLYTTINQHVVLRLGCKLVMRFIIATCWGLVLISLK